MLYLTALNRLKTISFSYIDDEGWSVGYEDSVKNLVISVINRKLAETNRCSLHTHIHHVSHITRSRKSLKISKKDKRKINLEKVYRNVSRILEI